MTSARFTWFSVATVVGLAMAGCSVQGDTPEASPSAEAVPPSASSTPSPDPSALAEADAELLPIPPDEITDWARGAVPNFDADGFVSASSGWLSEHTSTNLVSSDETLAPGDYVVQLACIGDGELTVTLSNLDDEPIGTEPQVCSRKTIAFDLATTEPGLRTTFTLEGAPTIYAMSVQSVP